MDKIKNMKYIKLFEEFNNTFIKSILDKIGKRLPKFGHAKICFEFGKNSIIKFFQLEDITEIYNCIQQRDLNLNVLPKIYKIGIIKPKDDEWFQNIFSEYIDKIEINIHEDIYFIIEEKVIFDNELKIKLIDIQDYYQDFCKKQGFKHVNFLRTLQYEIYKNIKTTLDLKLSYHMNLFKTTLSKTYYIPLFERLVEIYHTLLINDIIISDSNFDNFGKNKKGEIITFDLADVFNYGEEKDFNEKDLDIIL
jgi:hypothetical protein